MSYNISISHKASEQIKKKLFDRKTPNAHIRLGVKSGGCNGYAYVIEYDDNLPKDNDLIFVSEGIKIVVDKKSILYLNGTILDWEQKLMFTGFKFNNPLEKSRCGCGNSIEINKENS